MITTLRCCEICGDPVNFGGAFRCNRCWEVTTRLERMTPELLAVVVNEVLKDKTPDQRKEFLAGVGGYFCVHCGYDTCSGHCWNDE